MLQNSRRVEENCGAEIWCTVQGQMGPFCCPKCVSEHTPAHFFFSFSCWFTFLLGRGNIFCVHNGTMVAKGIKHNQHREVPSNGTQKGRQGNFDAKAELDRGLLKKEYMRLFFPSSVLLRLRCLQRTIVTSRGVGDARLFASKRIVSLLLSPSLAARLVGQTKVT